METKTINKTCSACAYWKQLEGETGECRVRAPQAIAFIVDAETKVETRFPSTAATDWCGEFDAR